jgi:hypothetical protein
MSRYTDLQREYVEHNDAPNQRAAIEPFVLSFVEELVRYLECPAGSLKFVVKDRETADNPRPAIRMSQNLIWALDMKLYPDVSASGARSSWWDIGLGIRKKWDSFLARTWIGGVAGTGSKSWKIPVNSPAAGIAEMCEWVYAQLTAFYRDYDYFRR